MSTNSSQDCPFSATTLVSPPDWVTASEPAEPPSPAYVRVDSVHFQPASPDVFLPIELSLHRLEAVEKCLWLAGRPMPARPLHAQLGMNRALTLTEQLDLHLLWQDGRIFLKPLPRCLLQPAFWRAYLLCGSGTGCCTCHRYLDPSASSSSACAAAHLRSIAIGFLLSWISLVQYESDLRIAQVSHFLPADLTWSFWHSLATQLLPLQQANQYAQSVPPFHPRWFYGELRMHRINLIYRFVPGLSASSWMRGYRSTFRSYQEYVQYIMAYFIGVFGVASIVLNAFQVGLTTDWLGGDSNFQRVSAGFALFSIIGLLSALALLILGIVINVLINLFMTLEFRNKRLREVKRSIGMEKKRSDEGNDRG